MSGDPLPTPMFSWKSGVWQALKHPALGWRAELWSQAADLIVPAPLVDSTGAHSGLKTSGSSSGACSQGQLVFRA